MWDTVRLLKLGGSLADVSQLFGTKGERLETGKPFPYKHTAETQPKAPILAH